MVLHKVLMHLVGWTGLGLALLAVFTPSQAEVEKIKRFSVREKTFSDVLVSASDPNSKPLYRRKPGEEFWKDENKSGQQQAPVQTYTSSRQ